jgi:iron complex transport system ATP-binding protein
MSPELMTCRDVVATGRYPYTSRLGILSEEDRRKVNDALDMVHAHELADRLFSQISDGQRLLLSTACCSAAVSPSQRVCCTKTT